MQRLSITKGHAFILVYSVCSRQSLEELRPIWSLIKELKVINTNTTDLSKWDLYNSFFSLILQGADITQIPVMLVGNKMDESAELREVTSTEGQAESVGWGVSFMETSAKTNHNVTELFQVGTFIFM
jgi:DIRAS family, GTP-binding Ras-like 2